MLLIKFLLLASYTVALTCPNLSSMRSKTVQSSFNLNTFGSNKRLFELGYKDLTQPRMCKCQTAQKTLNNPSNPTLVFDDFTIECAGFPYKSNLTFEITNTPGELTGTWNQAGFPVLSWIKFPDVVVDVGPVVEKDGMEYYDWIVEFQCIPGPFNSVLFYAFNFYSSDNTMRNYEAMLEVAMNKFPEFVEEGSAIHVVDHEDCWYDKMV